MPRGGFRENAPLFKSTWNLGKTKTIRVPIAISDLLVDIARTIDEGGAPDEVKGRVSQVLSRLEPAVGKDS